MSDCFINFGILLFWLDTSSSHVHSKQYKGHLQLKCTIAKHIETVLCIALEATEHIHSDTIYVAEYDAESNNTSLTLYGFMPISFSHVIFALRLHKN